MPKSKTLLYRIAEAFEKSAEQFAGENQRLAALGECEAITNPEPRYAVAEKVWIDFQDEAGVDVTIEPGADNKGIRLHLKNIGESRWFSFSYELGIEMAATARYIGLLMLSGNKGMAAFRPCLRYVFSDGFHDQFSSDVIVLTGGISEDLCFFKPDPDMIKKAVAVEILFFFEGGHFDVTLLEVENLYI